MTRLKLYFFAIFLACLAFSLNTYGQKNEKSGSNSKFDSKLAKQLGADDYGMRQYVLVVLKTGKADIKDPAKRKALFAGHFENMGNLAKDGKLVLAGPFIEGEGKRGLFIFNVKTLEEARKLVLTDPAVKAGIFEFELTKWYGSAALMQINEIHSRIQKEEIE